VIPFGTYTECASQYNHIRYTVDEKAKKYLNFHSQTFVPTVYEQLVKWLDLRN
jgi:hypothetical protein